MFVSASAGFYVRALARDLGQALGCGAHLDALRRTRVGRFDVAQALPLAEAERLGPAVDGAPAVPGRRARRPPVGHGDDGPETGRSR